MRTLIVYMTMKVNFMHQLDWAKGCPDGSNTLFLGVCMKVFPKQLSV